MKSNILKISKPADYDIWVGKHTDHDMITVIEYERVSPVRYSLNQYEVYGLFLQGDDMKVDLKYGSGKYDYSDGTLICVAPGQLGGKEDDGTAVNMTGWAVIFHPDLLQGTALEKEIHNFSFFDYRINEALHMSAEERDILINLFRQIEKELKFPHDELQNRIIVGFLNLILRYAQRFYNRQFKTRALANNDICARFDELLKNYFDSDAQQTHGLPTVKYCAEQLCLSPNYLNDVIKRTTGNTANSIIKNIIIRLAKNRLVAGMNSSEVAYSLGYEYPQHFARTFKKLTGETPTEYCRRRLTSNS